MSAVPFKFRDYSLLPRDMPLACGNVPFGFHKVSKLHRTVHEAKPMALSHIEPLPFHRKARRGTSSACARSHCEKPRAS